MYNISPLKTIKELSNDCKIHIYIMLLEKYNTMKKRDYDEPNKIRVTPYDFQELGYDRKTIYLALKKLEENGNIKVKKIKNSYVKEILLIK